MFLHFQKAGEGGYDWKHLMGSYRKYVKKDSVVLEIGASVRKKTIDLSRYCKKLIGVELNPERIFKDSGNIKYKIGDWQKLTKFIPKESIDIVVSSHTIEHIPKDLKAIDEIYKVLRPGGTAIINTPNRKRLTRTIAEVFTGERQFPWWEHIREYTEDDLKDLSLRSMFKNNFKIIPLVFGLHGGSTFLYLERPPKPLRKWANYLELHLFKGEK